MHKPLWLMNHLPSSLCEMASADFQKIEPKDASMGENSESKNHTHRNTTVRFIPPGHWFAHIMADFGRTANQRCNWGYEITGNENIQYAEYGKGQHYDWHIDTFPLGFQPFDRKVTVVSLLNSTADFEGGELKIKLYSEYDVPMMKGTMIAFPSILEHKVTPVLSGVRYSAAMWLHGPKFK